MNGDNEKISLLIVEDNELFREGLASLLSRRPDIELVGQAEDGFKALELARQTRPGVILMDVDMPGCDGVRATQLILEELPQINIIMLTVSDEDKDLFTAIRAGAKGYLLKEVKIEDLMKAIITVSKGGAVISPSMASKLLVEFNSSFNPESVGEKQSKQNLSDRELEVLTLVAEGATNRAVADKLVISENTVKVHLHNIMEKLHLRNRQQVAAYAVREGLITNISREDNPDY